jgi:protein-disulfide isomerase
MANRENDLERWVEERLESLEPPAGWQPDGERAFAGIERFDRKMRRRRVRRFVAVGAFTAVCVAAILLETPKAYCAGNACGNQQSGPTPVSPRTSEQGPQPLRQPVTIPAAPQQRTAVTRNFKEWGAVDAPIRCEIYNDYQCPPCAATYRNMLPRLIEQYADTGRIRLAYRDFPLPIHRFARLAARYANAAGRAGVYDTAVAQIFRTQAAWTATGDIDAELAEVLPPETMQKIRNLMNEDTTLDGTIEADIAMGHQDRITSTPTLVVVVHGRREKIPLHSSYELVSRYLDEFLSAARYRLIPRGSSALPW